MQCNFDQMLIKLKGPLDLLWGHCCISHLCSNATLLWSVTQHNRFFFFYPSLFHFPASSLDLQFSLYPLNFSLQFLILLPKFDYFCVIIEPPFHQKRVLQVKNMRLLGVESYKPQGIARISFDFWAMPCEMGNCVFHCDSEDFEHVCKRFCLAFSEMWITSVQWHGSMKGLIKIGT